ncbi:glutaredoxin domain-containing protein [Plectosphaerella plurivora]|uniref:Glutaredoxin-like protein n=1 Tax=Plectosphaerella plurivora TaxID=936078 RepID=A0A9P8V4I3_9PEZI|nr:glutaredoxin domain-containing protein [Plectosphaerella plurivora]
MFPTRPLLHSCRITLFMRDGCGLCIRAKSALSNVWDRRPFDFKEVNITHPDAKAWKDIYDFDVPAIHFNKPSAPEEDPKQVTKALKLMHRFDPVDIEAKMDEIEKASP